MIKIERARAEEVEEIKRVLDEAWSDTYGPFLSQETIQKVTSVWHDPVLLAAQVQNPDIFLGVAKNEADAILGMVTACKLDKDTVLIDRLYVHPRHQRKGIGSGLLREGILAFPGIRRVRLEVYGQNQKGLSFYLKQGFSEIGREEERIEAEILESVEMEKQLS